MGAGVTPSSPCHSPPAAVRTGLEVMSVGELALSHAGCSTRKSGPAPHLGSAVELTVVKRESELGPMGVRPQGLAQPHTDCSTWETTRNLSQVSTVELALKAWVWVSWPRGTRTGKLTLLMMPLSLPCRDN